MTSESLLRLRLVPGAIVVVAVPDVQPESSVVLEHSADLPRHPDYVDDVELRAALVPELPFMAVVPKAIVRRTGDTTLYALRLQFWNFHQGVAGNDFAVREHGKKEGGSCPERIFAQKPFYVIEVKSPSFHIWVYIGVK